jgi:hypothetical protein
MSSPTVPTPAPDEAPRDRVAPCTPGCIRRDRPADLGLHLDHTHRLCPCPCHRTEARA